MQDNEPLMRALAKVRPRRCEHTSAPLTLVRSQLVTVNNPDKIVFVGEALVGNEAVDQLTKFNRSLRDFSAGSNPRGIDGMILTKCDISVLSSSQSRMLIPAAARQIRHDRRQGATSLFPSHPSAVR